MTTRDEFEKWIKDQPDMAPDLTMIQGANGEMLYKSGPTRYSFKAWECRQKEINALKAEIERLKSEDDAELRAIIKKLSDITPRPPKAITYEDGWKIIDVVQRELCPAIDAAIQHAAGGDHA